MKLSPIFPGHIKPCADRPGVYLRNYTYYEDPEWSKCWWDGEEFLVFETPEDRLSLFQTLPWRGLSSKDGL